MRRYSRDGAPYRPAANPLADRRDEPRRDSHRLGYARFKVIGRAYKQVFQMRKHLRQTAFLALVLSVSAGVASAGTVGAAPPRSCRDRIGQISTAKGPAARDTLLPGGVRGLLVCRYAEPGEPVGMLAGSARLGPSRSLRTIVGELRGLPTEPPGTPPGFAPMCTLDVGYSIAIWAQYHTGADVEILVDQSGCSAVTNGTVNRTATGQLISVLDRLTRRLPSRR